MQKFSQMSASVKPNLEVQLIRNLPFPTPPQFPKNKIEKCLDYQPQDGDIIISSYPKTGTTWLQYIVLQITSKGESFPSFDDLQSKVSPYMEMAGVETVNDLPSPRTYKHHFPYNLMAQKNPKAKYLYVYRNPADAFVSNFYFIKDIGKYHIEFDQYFDDYLSGAIPYGSYFEHVMSYVRHKNDDNLLMVCYEHLQDNRRQEILRIAKFLGQEYYKELLEDEILLQNILERTSFEYMQKNLYMTRYNVRMQGRVAQNDTDKVCFFRKGKVGDGKNHLSVQQMDQLKETAKKYMKDTDILKEWLALYD